MTNHSYFHQHSSTVIQRIYDGEHTKLYPHQRQALLRLLEMGACDELAPEKRSFDSGAAFFLIGVGCGKTVILQAAPYILGRYMRGRQVIFLSHNCTLRQRIMEDFPFKKGLKGKVEPIFEEWALYKYGFLDQHSRPPSILELKAENYTDVSFNVDKVDILVANWQFLKNLVSRGDIRPSHVGLIVVDEAHHSAAFSYSAIFNYFPNAILVFLTGTRHRGDGEELPYVRYVTEQYEELNGQITLRKAPRTDFEFTIQDAWKVQPPIIKRITFSPAKSDGFKVEEEGQEVEYTVEQFYEKAEKERAWFHNCILADSFCKPVLDRAVEILELKRSGQGLEQKRHQMIIRALNIKHAYRLRELCQGYSLLRDRVGLVHSPNQEFDPEGRPSEIFNKFATGEYIALIHVSMVGEGFNVPYASVSVPLCIMRSTQKAEQEFGRIIRKVQGTYPAPYDWGDLQADNLAVVVTHEALKIGDLFEQFVSGDEYITIDDENEEGVNRNRILTDEYRAGDTRLRLTNTDGLSSGDEVIVKTLDHEGKEQTSSFNVTKVLGKGTLEVFPLLVDIPQGCPARKVADREESSAEFIGHVRLRWHLRINGKDVPVEEYRRQKALERENLIQNADGEISTPEGERISDLPSQFRRMILEQLRQDEGQIELPFQDLEISCLPGETKKGMQEHHLKRIRKAVKDISILTLDGRTGKNLINQPLNSLRDYLDKPVSNNEQLLYRAVLGHVKRVTGKEWKKHQTEEEFENAVQIAFSKVEEVRAELKARRRPTRN